VSGVCLALPEATHEESGPHDTYRVRGKTFAYFVQDHHGDGIVGVHVKARPGENEALIAEHPERFFMPAYVGPRGWVGLRLDTPEPDWQEAEGMLVESYLLTAPVGLARKVRRDRPPE